MSTDERALPAGLVVSLRTGSIGTMRYRDGRISSAFRKFETERRLTIDLLGLAGDEHADRKNHGGPEKAICVYPVENYEHWRAHLPCRLDPGDFAENLTVSGLGEAAVCIGDAIRAGKALMQISQPRRPCYKLAAFHKLVELPHLVQASGRSGYYLRVLEPGALKTGDPLSVVERPHPELTVAAANRAMYDGSPDVEAISTFLVPELSERWRRSLSNRVEGGKGDTLARLAGHRVGVHGASPD